MAIFKPSLLTLALTTAGLTMGGISLPTHAQEAQAQEQAQSNLAESKQAEPKQADPTASQQDSETSTSVSAETTQTNAAQEDEEGNKMIITGFRGSLLRSVDEKRVADTVSEHLSADDLGALPDISIADALTRLPGIAAVRTGGQAAEINIRGLSGVFVHTTLNGREQVSTSGTRSVEFDQYPSELISSAAIYKSQKASLIEGGVAGTVELRTASPLSMRNQHTFNASVRGMFNDRSDEVYDSKSSGDRFSFSYQGKFADDTLGFSVGYARLFQPNVATQFIGLAYNATQDVDGIANDTGGPDNCPECEYISEGFEMQHRGGEETRNGYVGVIEWAPNDTFRLKADAFISDFDSEAFARGFRVKFDGSTADILNPVVFNNAVIGGTINRNNNNTRVEIVNDDNTDYDRVENYGVNAEWILTDQFTLTGDISYSTASSNFRNGLLWSLVSEDTSADPLVLDENVSIAYQLNGLNLPNIGFNQNFTDLNRVALSKYGIYPFENDDTLKAIRFDGKYDLIDNDIFSSFEFGMRYSERQYSADRSVFEYGQDNLFLTSEPPLRLTNDMVTVVDWSGDFAYFPSYLAIDYDAALNAWFPNGVPQPAQTWGVNSQGEIDYSTSWSILESGDVWEDVTAAYFMANIDAEWGDVPITGNFGVRVIESQQYATFIEDVGGSLEQGAQNITDETGLVSSRYASRVVGTTYTDTLPQLNLNFKITDDSQIRFAAARVMSRPDINRLAANASSNIADDGEFSASSRNSPFLMPFMADQYDISYEHYFDKSDGAFVVALFYKDIKSFVQNFDLFEFDFAGNGFNVPTYVPGTEPGNEDSLPPVLVTNGTYSTAVNNAEGGYFRGLELSYTEIYSGLPGIWSGLGVSASYAYTDSSVSLITDLAGTSYEQTFPGLSEHVLNASVFLNYDQFETRVAIRNRSDFVSEQVAVNTQQAFFDSETVIDYQASYDINDNSRVVFQVNNLTDQPTKSYFGTQAQTGTIQYFGRQYFLGLSYQL
ncbi:TonB-dependent receptor [Aliikangiella marina]|uniref:TonB-dependent receptor n=1 Tax=Aliikangiella marina TaxID=1712262 RepID=A0A545TCU6_9GAMM|nr:TonB-dependent receptor [Aliikangiella marina]TQV75037.1 TonB-dependent receptor [Aliikangiella marina]